MHVDLLTLYFLAIGTLLASAAMTLWEAATHPGRGKALKVLAGGYVALAVGCVLAIIRSHLPGITGAALSNLVILAGYLLVLNGVASFSGRRYLTLSIVLWLVELLAWMVAGERWLGLMWSYGSALFIALVSGLAARDILRMKGTRGRQSRHIVAAVLGIHAAFYAARVLVLPWLVAWYGPQAQAFAGPLTMYEGVLYSVVFPMAILRLIREEAHGELLRESRTDYLTQLGNRRWFFEEGERLIRDSDASVPMSLLALDLDHFKVINDRYGHKTGDEVLQSFARIARHVVGEGAMLARIGGEEFVALLPGHDRERARALGDALVRRFAETALHGIHGVRVVATVSVGLAQLGPAAPSLTALLAASDRALYQAKSLGGNRLELA